MCDWQSAGWPFLQHTLDMRQQLHSCASSGSKPVVENRQWEIAASGASCSAAELMKQPMGLLCSWRRLDKQRQLGTLPCFVCWP